MPQASGEATGLEQEASKLGGRKGRVGRELEPGSSGLTSVPGQPLHSAGVAYENLSCLQAKETTVGTPRGIFDPPLLCVLHRPGAGFQ